MLVNYGDNSMFECERIHICMLLISPRFKETAVMIDTASNVIFRLLPVTPGYQNMYSSATGVNTFEH